jgi:two-component system phosphate regulon sensor histidine kinase PhoR
MRDRAVTDTRTESNRPGAPWISAIVRARLVLGIGAALFALLYLGGLLAWAPALLGFILIAAAAFYSQAAGDGRHAAAELDPATSLTEDYPLLDAVVSGLPDPVVAIGGDGRVVAFNAQASAMAPALRRGEPALFALRAPDLVEAIRGAIASGRVLRADVYERVPVERWFEAIIMPVKFQEGVTQPDLVLLTFHDLTPLRRVEEMRADFVANASHELRTPLAALSGFIDTLLGPARDDPAVREKFLTIMQAQATRMARLIDDLLSLSRIELSAHVRPTTRVDLVPIVRQVVDGLQTLARDRDVKIKVDAPAQPVIVAGDRDELLRVFENLIENGLKYGANGKRLDIVFGSGPSPQGVPETRVAVRDYGPGIAPEHLPRLTERFYRVDVGESRAQGGTGLGLALVKHILNRHRGRLTIESTPGTGATFTAHFPMNTETPSA